ncbi:MAG: hypothetical protein K6F34_07265, partial [Lachnospiraceae bacterium]|nr:hypothetical protein [Lachnospiraceae bacterium]
MNSVVINGFKSKLAYKNGEAVEQATVLTYKDRTGTHTLKEYNTANPDGDYTVTYKNNHEPGTATVIYEAVKDEHDEYTGAFRGRIVKTFGITGKSVIKEAAGDELNVGECKIILGTETDDDKYAFTNEQIKPAVTVKAKIINNEGDEEEVILRSGKDYTLKYQNNKSVAASDAKKKGKDVAPQVIIKGKGNYVFGTTQNAGIVKRFTIVPVDLKDLILTISDRVYSKKAGDYKKTKILFTDGNYRDLKLKAGAGKDYTVTYETSDESQAPIAGQVVTVTIKGNNNDQLTGTGSCKGEVKGSYRIIDGKKHKDINKASVVVNPNSKGKASACIYTGSGIEPGQDGQPELRITFGSGKSKVTLTRKTAHNPDGDYEILGYFNNVNKGNSAVILIRGTGGTFRGVRAVKFKIAARGVGSRWGGVYGRTE